MTTACHSLHFAWHFLAGLAARCCQANGFANVRKAFFDFDARDKTFNLGTVVREWSAVKLKSSYDYSAALQSSARNQRDGTDRTGLRPREANALPAVRSRQMDHHRFLRVAGRPR